MRELFAIILLSALSLHAERTTPAVFYVDDQRGSDLADGTSPDKAWKSLTHLNQQAIIAGDKVLFRSGGLWRGQLLPKSGSEAQRVLYSSYGEGSKPIIQSSLDYSTADCWRASSSGIWSTYAVGNTAGRTIPCDVGILIMDHGQAWGVKKWGLDQLTKPLDFWYDPSAFQLHVKMDKNPAQLYRSVELALKKHIVDQSGCHDITYDGIAIRYGAAHGFGGSNTKNITIRNCDISWIGGALQLMHEKGFPVRYGNGIEFWNSASNNLVENNCIWEIYDAALTNQGNGDGKNVSDQVNITYRNNLIWNAEYSFEYWNRPESAVTKNVIFEHNTCVDAGCGWAHNQRPDKNGAHLMFYQNRAQTTGLVVRNNIFVNSTEVITRMENDWRSGLSMYNNLLHQEEKPIVRWLIKNYYGKEDFAKYQTELNLDAASAFARPTFKDPSKRDYTLTPGSAGETLATDGGCVGVRK